MPAQGPKHHEVWTGPGASTACFVNYTDGIVTWVRSDSPNGVFICLVWPREEVRRACFLDRPGISQVYFFSFLNLISLGGSGGSPAAWFVSHLHFELYAAYFRQWIFNDLELYYDCLL